MWHKSPPIVGGERAGPRGFRSQVSAPHMGCWLPRGRLLRLDLGAGALGSDTELTTG